jgi:hypothetical protein
MDKLDLKKQFKSLYSPSDKEFSIIEMPPLPYIMVDGHGDPNTSAEYEAALQTLFSLAYTLKFHVKKTMERDYNVMGLEGLWWTAEMSQFSMQRKADWDWTMMILQPDFITPELFAEAKKMAIAKGKAPRFDKSHFETYQEGTCVQIMYYGPYDDEPPTIAAMHKFIHDQGYILTGKHHEIYLTDVRRVAPEKNKTILRQAVKKG